MELFLAGNAQLLTIHITGDVVGETCEALRETVDSVKDRTPELVLDFSNVRKVDAEGVGLLLALHFDALSAGVQFSIRNPSPEVMETFKESNLDTILGIT